MFLMYLVFVLISYGKTHIHGMNGMKKEVFVL